MLFIQKKSVHGCIPILSPLSLATGGCLPFTSRRTVLGPKTCNVPRIVVHLQVPWLSHAWRFIFVVKKSLSAKCICLVGNACSQARRVVIGPCIVQMTQCRLLRFGLSLHGVCHHRELGRGPRPWSTASPSPQQNARNEQPPHL